MIIVNVYVQLLVGLPNNFQIQCFDAPLYVSSTHSHTKKKSLLIYIYLFFLLSSSSSFGSSRIDDVPVFPHLFSLPFYEFNFFFLVQLQRYTLSLLSLRIIIIFIFIFTQRSSTEYELSTFYACVCALFDVKWLITQTNMFYDIFFTLTCQSNSGIFLSARRFFFHSMNGFADFFLWVLLASTFDESTTAFVWNIFFSPDNNNNGGKNFLCFICA